MCANIRDNANLSSLKRIDFNKLNREEQNIVKESVYTMMKKFKNTPLKLDNSMLKELYSSAENKQNYCLNMEKINKRFNIGLSNA